MNPFQLISYLLFHVRHSLEDASDPSRPPRWVRISRARVAREEVLGNLVREGVKGFARGSAYMIELALDLEELLVQTDAGAALFEVTADLLAAATSDEFVSGVASLAGESLAGDNPMGGVNGIIQQIKGYAQYIPEPGDVSCLGHELYRLNCIQQRALSRDDSSEHLDVTSTGKIRLMQWAFEIDAPIRGLGTVDAPESDSAQHRCLGSRRLWKPTDGDSSQPTASRVLYSINGKDEPLVELHFAGVDEAERTRDLVELHTILGKLGYKPGPHSTAYTPELTRALRQFQILNELPRTGVLDNATLNRLFHLDHARKNLARARPFDARKLPLDEQDPQITAGAIELINPDADAPTDEGTQIERSQPGYAYYVVGHSAGPDFPNKGGWVTEPGSGFVALHSRLVRGSNDEVRFDGDRLSEGESADGTMFFAARHTEPWAAGRSGTPGSNALFGGKPPSPGSVSRIYQWVNLTKVRNRLNIPNTHSLVLYATVLARSLYTDRSRTTRLPDQGRVFLELYGAEGFDGTLGGLRDPEKRLEFTESGWFPEHGTVIEELSLEEVARKRNWQARRTNTISVPEEAKAALIGLEGRFQSGWDIDAYFDQVRLQFEVRANPGE